MTFASVDEAMKYFADPELVNMLKLALQMQGPRTGKDRAMEEKMRTTLDFITSGALRSQLEKQFQETGKLEFRYSPSAFEYLRKHS